MEFQVFHTYNRLVRRGMVKPLLHSCGFEYALVMGDDDEPVLKCFSCNTTTRPGTRLYDTVKAVVREHFI